jgi:hypothetical protein
MLKIEASELTKKASEFPRVGMGVLGVIRIFHWRN